MMFINPKHKEQAVELTSNCAVNKQNSWTWSEALHQLSLNSFVFQGSEAKPHWAYLDLHSVTHVQSMDLSPKCQLQ